MLRLLSKVCHENSYMSFFEIRYAWYDSNSLLMSSWTLPFKKASPHMATLVMTVTKSLKRGGRFRRVRDLRPWCGVRRTMAGDRLPQTLVGPFGGMDTSGRRGQPHHSGRKVVVGQSCGRLQSTLGLFLGTAELDPVFLASPIRVVWNSRREGQAYWRAVGRGRRAIEA